MQAIWLEIVVVFYIEGNLLIAEYSGTTLGSSFGAWDAIKRMEWHMHGKMQTSLLSCVPYSYPTALP